MIGDSHRNAWRRRKINQLSPVVFILWKRWEREGLRILMNRGRERHLKPVILASILHQNKAREYDPCTRNRHAVHGGYDSSPPLVYMMMTVVSVLAKGRKVRFFSISRLNERRPNPISLPLQKNESLTNFHGSPNLAKEGGTKNYPLGYSLQFIVVSKNASSVNLAIYRM